MRNDIFLSYSRADREFAEKLVQLAEERGLHIWFDKGIADDAASWREDLMKALDGSKAMVFLFSEHCNKSTELIKELGVANKLKKPVIVVKIGEGEPKNQYLYELVSRQWTFLHPDLATKTPPFVDRLAQQWAGSAAPAPAAASAPDKPALPEAPAAKAWASLPRPPSGWFPWRARDVWVLGPVLLLSFGMALRGKADLGLGLSSIAFMIYLFVIAVRNARRNRSIFSGQSFCSYMAVLVVGFSPMLLAGVADPDKFSGWDAAAGIMLLASLLAVPANVLQVLLRAVFMRNLFRKKMAAGDG